MIQEPRLDTIPFASLRQVNSIFRAYVEGQSVSRDFFRWDPRQSPEGLLEELRGRSYGRGELADLLTDQNRDWGASEETLERIGRLRDPRATTVVTGQQVGLFGGPFYTLYKALTAVAVARRWESQWRVPCLPLFWMASEDTDFAEIDHTAMPDDRDRVEVLRYDPERGFGADLPATHTLTPKIGEAFETLKRALGPGRLEERVHALLQECYRPGVTLVTAFGRLLTALLGTQGLILVDPADPRLKALARPLFLREIETAPTSAHLVQAAAEKLRALGYSPQLRLRGDGPNLFYVHEGRRLLKMGAGTSITVPGVERWEDHRALAEGVERSPERFSPNAALRPVMEAFLFPTVAHVGGPHEIAYYAQLQAVFDHFGTPMPLLLPRASLTLVEGRIARLLTKHALSFPALGQGSERVLSHTLRRSLPKTLTSKQQRVLQTILKGFAELKALVETFDPTLTPRLGRVEGVVKRQLAEMERLVLRSYKRRNQEVQTQLLRVFTHLYPQGNLQERVYGFMPYLCRHGSPLLDVIARAIDGPGWEHRLLFVGGTSARR